MALFFRLRATLWQSFLRFASIIAIHMHNRHLMVWDIITQPVIVLLAFVIRLDAHEVAAYQAEILHYGLLCTIIVPLVFYLIGMYRRFWHYASLNEVVYIVAGSLVASLLPTVIYFLLLGTLVFEESIPRSIPIITFFLLIVGSATPRYLMRLGNHYRPRDNQTSQTRKTVNVLIAGAGDIGNKVLHELLANPALGLIPVGFVDDDPEKVNLEIMGCRVLGTISAIPFWVHSRKVNRVLISMPSAGGKAIRQITDICRSVGVEVLTLPGVSELYFGGVSITRMRPVRVEDLLRREAVQIDQAKVQAFLGGHSILVTGGGGSIGREICRQVASFRPARLIVLGHGEDSIYHIEHELRLAYPNLELVAVIADLRDRPRMDAILDRWQPDTILHAAAHKHVPLMETNAPDAVTNNIFGTLNLVDSAVAHKVAHLVMISSDKAVNPVNIMGTTKRVAELLVRDAAFRSGLDFVAVRFGNVLGSSGSVAPLFEQQIAAGGPVTVTHPDMRRYFMTIPEAVQLVLQAATLGHGGEIFVLDMGEPIRIVDLARDMITLSGYEVNKDIKIVFTGLRPGEKLFEEICVSDEHYAPSPHGKIFVLRTNGDGVTSEKSTLLHAQVARLGEAAKAGDIVDLKKILHEIVPECYLAD